MIMSKLVHSTWGRVRVINGYKDHKRLYVMRTNVKSYVVCTKRHISFESMILIDNKAHFGTLMELNIALNK